MIARVDDVQRLERQVARLKLTIGRLRNEIARLNAVQAPPERVSLWSRVIRWWRG